MIPITKDTIEEVIAKFHEDMPDEAIVTQKKYGNVFKGYGVGWTIDRLNQIVGPHQWNIRALKSHVERIENAYVATVLVALAIGPPRTWAEDDIDPDNELYAKFTVVPIIYKEAWGDCVNPGYGDALKGAMSDASKKALSMIGIGVKAYKGLLGDVEDDNLHVDFYGSRKKSGNKEVLPWEE